MLWPQDGSKGKNIRTDSILRVMYMYTHSHAYVYTHTYPPKEKPIVRHTNYY